MASTVNLLTVFRGENQMAPAMNEISGGLTNVGQKMQQVGTQGSRSASMLTREWDKFHRTFGYALAGLGTYAIFNAIGKLRDYQTELAGLNSILADTPGELNKFGQAAIEISTRTAQPLNDVLASMQNIAQSIPNLSRAARQHLIPAMAEIEAMGSRVAGTDPRSFGSTVLGLARGFYGLNALRDPRNNFARGKGILETVANQLVTTGKTTPRTTGQDINTYIPMLAGGALTSGFTLPQMLSLFTVAQGVIQRPATTAQYLRQLMIRLHQPTKAEMPYFAQAGLTPSVLAGLNKSGGGMTILQTIMAHALSLGHNNLGGLSPQEFLKHGSYKRLQISPEAAQFIQQTIGGRIQSLVAARALSASIQQVPLQEQNLRNAPSVQSRFQNMNLSMLKASNALSNMATSIGTDFLPAINVGSTALTALSGGVTKITGGLNSMATDINRHTHGIPVLGGRIGGATEIAALVAAGIGGRRLSGLIRGRLGGRNPLGGALSAERGLLETEAASSALSGIARGTPSAPFWVVIHPLSMSQIPALSGKGPFNSGGGNVEKTIVNDAKKYGPGAIALAKAKSFLQRIGGKAAGDIKFASGWLGEEGAGAALGASALLAGGMAFADRGEVGKTFHIGQNTYSSLAGARFFGPHNKHTLTNQFLMALHGRRIPKGLEPYFGLAMAGKITPAQLDAVVGNYARQTAIATRSHPGNVNSLQQAITSMFRLGPGHQLRLSHVDRTHAAQGFVEATLSLVPTQEFAKLLKPQEVRVHIPINQGSPAPKSRGRSRTPRTVK